MLQLAAVGGCQGCHARVPEAGKPGVGPAWTEVARKYQGDPQARQKLTWTVLKGSNPYEPHWAGKVSGLAMPEHAAAISEIDAQYLVRWILEQTN